MGRKSKYNPEYHLRWIEGLARRGLTTEQIAEDLGVAKSTVNKWIKDNEELSDSIKKARSIADVKVETSLYQRACGMKITKRKTILQTGKEGVSQPAKVEIFEEDVPPDTTACIFWLKNRLPKNWRDKQDVSMNVNSFEGLIMSLPDEEE